jgi:hypothetical protein
MEKPVLYFLKLNEIVAMERHMSRRVWVAVPVLLIGCVVVLFLIYPARKVEEKFPFYWGEAGSGAYHLSPGQNFYENPPAFPNVGLVFYTIDSSKWDREVELNAISAAISRCRSDYGRGFREGKIEAYFNDITLPPELQKSRLGPFQPMEIVILIRNVADFPPKLPDGSRESLPFEEWTKPIKVGYLFSASSFFDSNKTIESLLAASFRDEQPVHFIKDAKTPGEEMVLDIVARHMAGVK